jgi:hypothetical protein
MKSLIIQILEFVRNQPAHRLPALFNQEECPLPECTESPEDVFQEVLRMQKEGLVEAHVNRDCKSNPKQLEIRYVTLAGANYLEAKNGKLREPDPIGMSSSGALLSFLRR